MITIRQGDALEVLRELPDASVDAFITDPPYCSGGFSESARMAATSQGIASERRPVVRWFSGDNMGTAGLAWLLREMAVQASRLLKSTGSVLIFCDWRMAPTLIPAIESAGLRYRGLLVWVKENGGLGLGFRHQHELVMHFAPGVPDYQSCAETDVLQVPRVRGGVSGAPHRETDRAPRAARSSRRAGWWRCG